MGDDWVSTAIVLLVIVIMVVVWLPRRTGDSMRKVTEHRQDRHSPSLHVIDASDGMRFSDGVTPTVKGVLMQPDGTASSRLTRSRVIQVRRMRREAARRRRLLVLSLLVVGVVSVVALEVLRIPLWWSLLAFVPCLVVLGLGARVSARARDWERMVKRSGVMDGSPEVGSYASSRASASVAATPSSRTAQDVVPSRDETPTDVLEARQIRQAVDRARGDTGPKPSPQDGAVVQAQVVSVDRLAVEAFPDVDSSTEGAGQDLISFSLGDSDDDVVRANGPESREIQSTRQVAKAVPPVDSRNAADFHEGELDAQIDAPEATPESLGTGIESILARRSK